MPTRTQLLNLHFRVIRASIDKQHHSFAGGAHVFEILGLLRKVQTESRHTYKRRYQNAYAFLGQMTFEIIRVEQAD